MYNLALATKVSAQRLLTKVYQIYESVNNIVKSGVRVSGFVCFLGIGVGVAVASWLLSRLLLSYSRPGRRKPSADDVESQAADGKDDDVNNHGDRSSKFHRQNPKRQAFRRRGRMGNEHSLRSDEAMRYSDLQNRHEVDQSRINNSALGASIREPYTNTVLTHNMPAASCVSDCVRQQTSDAETRDYSGANCSTQSQHRINKNREVVLSPLPSASRSTSNPDITQDQTQYSDNVRGISSSDRVSRDDSLDSAHAECASSLPEASQLVDQPVDCKMSESMKDSGYGFMEGLEARGTDTSLNVTVQTQHGSYDTPLVCANNNRISADSIRSSTSDATDRDLNASLLSPVDTTLNDSHLPDDVETLGSRLELSHNSEDDVNDIIQRCSTSLDEHDKVPTNKTASTPAPVEQSSHYDSVMQNRDLFNNADSRSLSEESDVFDSPAAAAHPTSLELKRKTYRDSKVPSPSGSPMLSRGERSRSSSVMSIDTSFETINIKETQITAFMDIQSNIVEVNKEFNDIEDTLKRLLKADSGETYTSYKTTSKLANLVSDNSCSFNISDGHLDKAHDVLRKYSGSQSNYPRNSSEPPISDSRGNSVDTEAMRFCESQSLQSIPQQYVLHEDITNRRHWNVASEEFDHSSVSSMATCDTSLGEGRRGSITSVSTVATGDNIEAIVDCKFVVDLKKYAEREWKGDTKNAQTIRMGYQSLIDEHKYKSLVRIRGDNYCALRAAYASMILHNVYSEQSTYTAMQRLESLYQTEPQLIHSWSFANRFPHILKDQKYSKLQSCLEYFLLKTQSLHILTSPHEKQLQLFELLNSGTDDEIYLLEAMKLLLFLSAYELYQQNIAGEEVPVFVWLMYARDTSETPAQLLSNHFNKCGDSGGLEQVEMCLIGYVFGVTLQVFRLYQYGQVDFSAHYPEEENPQHKLPLVAEDDRHYNTVVYNESLNTA